MSSFFQLVFGKSSKNQTKRQKCFLGGLWAALWTHYGARSAFVIFETIPCERVPSFGTHFRYFSAAFLCWSLKIYRKGALERGVESGSNTKYIFGSPRTLWGVLAPARQLNSHFFVLDPPGTTCGAILGSNWSQKSPLYSFGDKRGHLGGQKWRPNFVVWLPWGAGAVPREGDPPPVRPCPGRDYREGYRYRRQFLVRWNSYEVLPHAVTCYAGRQIMRLVSQSSIPKL